MTLKQCQEGAATRSPNDIRKVRDYPNIYCTIVPTRSNIMEKLLSCHSTILCGSANSAHVIAQRVHYVDHLCVAAWAVRDPA